MNSSSAKSELKRHSLIEKIRQMKNPDDRKKAVDKIKSRYQDEMNKSWSCPNTGCIIADNTRADGYAQVKIRLNMKEHGIKVDGETPRTYTLPALDYQGDLSNKDFSHLCGNGSAGCINPQHVVIEDHKKNLDRKRCQSRGWCHCCGKYVYEFTCNCTPRCIQNTKRLIVRKSQ